MTEPVVFVFTFLKWFAGKKPLGDGLVAPVVSKHEGRRKSMQFLPVSFGDSSGERVDPQFLKSFLCGFLGFCNFLDVFLARNRKSIGVGVVQHPGAIHNYFLFLLFLAHPVTISFCAAGTPRRKATVQHPSVSFDSFIKPFVQILKIYFISRLVTFSNSQKSPTSTRAASPCPPGAFSRRPWRSK